MTEPLKVGDHIRLPDGRLAEVLRVTGSATVRPYKKTNIGPFGRRVSMREVWTGDAFQISVTSEVERL